MNKYLMNLKSEFHRSRTLVFVVFLFCMAAVFSFIATGNSRSSQAADATKFQAGNIISDAVMGNYTSMTVAEIQNFLDSKNKCDNRDYNQYLELSNRYPHIKWHWEGEPYNGHFVCMAQERFGDTASEIGTGMTAAEIIYAAAQDNRINPQVLLVLLQKESSLITDKVPNSLDYSKATGYGCPDTAACDSKYSGFKNQVYRAAELFRYTLDNGSVSFPEGRKVYIGYHPSSSCGGSQVLIENRATAALYRYTPYQPNSAAINAGYGSGNSCSAYGNRNFYLYFTDWFGSTQAAVDGELLIIPDGEYSLVPAANTGTSLGLSGSKAHLTALDTTDQSQRWSIRRDSSTGYYQITNRSTAQPLITQTTEPGMGTGILSGQSTTCSKNWKIYRTADNYLTIESACASGIVLDAGSNNPINGTKAQTYIANGSKAQKWSLHTGPVIQDGVYQIVSALDSGQVLDVNAGSDAKGINISSWQQYPSKGHQQWQIQYHAVGDYYSIINAYTGKSLDANGGSAKNGTKISVWDTNNSCAQKWQIIENEGVYSIHSMCSVGYILDLNGSAKNGTRVSLWQVHGGANQQWRLRTATPAIPEGVYNVVSKTSNLASFDVINGINQDGANVAVWQLHGGTNQQWQAIYNPTDGTYKFRNIQTGRYLGLANQGAKNSTNIQIQSDDNSCAVKWYVYPETDNYHRITSSCRTITSVDLNGGFQNGNNITIWQSHGGVHQQWQFVNPPAQE